jgi:hypothetical protein
VKDALTDEIIHECDFAARANASTLVADLPIYYSDRRILIFEWETGEDRGFNHYVCGYPPISLETYKKFLKRIGY